MSKLLLGFNILTILAAYLLYQSGVRLYLDDGYDVLPPSVLRSRGEYTPPHVEQVPISIPISSQPTDPISPHSSWGGSGSKQNYTCTNLRMRPKFLSYDPIMVYIEDFMSPYETKHLKTLAEAQYEPSVVENFNKDPENKDTYVDSSQRKSETAWLEDGDAVVDCVKSRAAEFQGFAPNKSMEELAVLKYRPGGSFTPHYDWHSAPPQAIDRRTSFFATIEASPDLEGGATWFGRVPRPAWARLQPWCDRGLLDCSYEVGLAVKPVEGNAVFWVNFREDGQGHEGTAHGGEPVIKGSKIGLNIWTQARLRAE
ncbi:hypothetical protein N0V93_002732 [Gnomoniopsis smithogilvyi]|uniref:Prolyl 4-hydroxylase alpha subunit domain-containing protein n=1 Tax=Gnomoniopsis smithogilvyi TaxID=1191159 RepID=A0A9W9CXX7_9PEZI|nr:hypothetical protein N0V93_002732 [Gnomoniopsis smithogilvyi]